MLLRALLSRSVGLICCSAQLTAATTVAALWREEKERKQVKCVVHSLPDLNVIVEFISNVSKALFNVTSFASAVILRNSSLCGPEN